MRVDLSELTENVAAVFVYLDRRTMSMRFKKARLTCTVGRTIFRTRHACGTVRAELRDAWTFDRIVAEELYDY